MYKRFMTWKIPGVKIEASFEGITQSATTDEEGYYEFRMELPRPVKGDHSRHKIQIQLANKTTKNQKPPVVYSQVFIPSEQVEFIVISDTDDTIVPTGATRLWQMLKTTFLKNAQTRVPFSGVMAIFVHYF